MPDHHDHDHDHHDHGHGHGTLTLEDRHDHEAEIYDAMALELLATWDDDEFRVDPDQIPFHNREHVDYLTKAIDHLRPLDGARILEVGAGGGSLAVWLALQGAEVVGIDVSAGILEVAAKRAEVSGVADRTTFVHSPIETFVDPGGPFDAVIGNNVVHHFELDLAMANIARLLDPAGRAVFCEPVLFIPEVFRTARNSSVVTRFFPMHTHTPDERSLNRDDLEVIARHFADVDWEPVQLLCRLQNFVELSDPVWNRLEAIDRTLLDKVKASRSLCRMIVLHLTHPNAERAEASAA
jgi:2-polyprenyl-3-methyl-5-hydroxy-6-metoxy-1,4-benzoquinol methylase